ncbi:peroxidasin homolog pxn-1-like [Frankliniella occidentalis]|uniref:Peroxidasin homolog pxn-1-like n=1 Tax=Frankliniella occidentalis TaxID=133901 RepID=A0A9C6X175_FRAOC|nr:peroxidasin homolog pxn-1-like [Frankliniella occidentalis]
MRLLLPSGRDHAIRPYNDYRALCNLKRATTWDDLSREIPAEVIARLQRMYPTVDDIDLFPGGLSERPLQGGLVGPTFACIIGIQFRQIRKCDRFWYENDDPVSRFTEAQLAEIRKATLSKILCANLDAESDMQRSALDQPNNFLNPRLPCHSLPSIDLNAWRETHQGCNIGGRSVAVGESSLPSPCTSCICTEEGAQCASLRITDCGQLMREASRDSILRDDVCMAQCGFLLEPIDAAAAPASGPDLGPSQHIEFTTAPSRRPGSGRQLPPELLAPPPPFRRGPGGPPPRASRRNPRVLRPPPNGGFSGLRIPDFSSIIG